MAKTVGNTTGQPNDLTVATGAGTVDTDTQRLTLASDDPAVTALQAISGRPRMTRYDLVTQASAVGANDQLADEVELTSMSLVANGGGRILNLVLASYNLTTIAAELWLYSVNPTAAGTNAVHDQSDANHGTSRHFAVIDFNVWITTTSNMTATGVWRGMPLGAAPLYYQCLDGTNTTSIWGILVTRTAVTPGATTDYDLDVTHIAGY